MRFVRNRTAERNKSRGVVVSLWDYFGAILFDGGVPCKMVVVHGGFTMDFSKPISNGKRVVGMMAAMVLGTAVSTSDARAAMVTAPQTSAINDITRYCQVCWRNARLPADRWGDCTQQVFTRLLQNVE